VKAKVKRTATAWMDLVILAALIAASVTAGILWSAEDRFTMIGVFCALVMGVFGHQRTFASVFLLSGALILLSFSKTPFNSILFILGADAIASVWYFSKVSWFKTRDSADLGILVPAFFSVFMFLIVDIYPVDAHLATYLTYLFFLLKPLSWAKLGQLTDVESDRFESIMGVLSILAFSHIYHPVLSLEYSLIAAACGVALAFLGGGMAAPTLIFLSLVHLVPAWIAFGGFVCFCSLYKGWPLRLLLVGLAAGFTIQFKLSQDPFYWASAILGALVMSIMFVRNLPKLQDLKIEWRGILLALVLLGIPIYMNPALMEISIDDMDGSTFGVAVTFVVFVTVLIFWKPKFIRGFDLPPKLWQRFIAFIQVGMKEVPAEVTAPYRVEAGEQKFTFGERSSFQILLWLLIVTAAIIILGGL
jgi:hypothetical protein